MKKTLLTIGVLVLGFLSLHADPATIVKTKCMACHGLNMEKSAMGKSAIVNTFTSAKIKEDLEGYKSGKLNQHGMGAVMQAQAKTLSDADIDALAKYIPTLKK